MHCSSTVYRIYRYFIQKKKIKMSSTILFKYLKIISLQYFQFLVSTKISLIQTDHKY